MISFIKSFLRRHNNLSPREASSETKSIICSITVSNLGLVSNLESVVDMLGKNKSAIVFLI